MPLILLLDGEPTRSFIQERFDEQVTIARTWVLGMPGTHEATIANIADPRPWWRMTVEDSEV